MAPNTEPTALNLLTVFEDRPREMGIGLWLALLDLELLQVTDGAQLGQVLTPDRIFYDLGQAVEM